MNKERYLQALAEEVNKSVEALLSDTPAETPVQRPVVRAVERRAPPRNIETVIRQNRSHAALFPGVSSTIAQFDKDFD